MLNKSLILKIKSPLLTKLQTFRTRPYLKCALLSASVLGMSFLLPASCLAQSSVELRPETNGKVSKQHKNTRHPKNDAPYEAKTKGLQQTSSPTAKIVEQELQENKILISKLKDQLSALKLKESDAMKTLQTLEAELNSALKSLAEAEALIANSEREQSALQESMNSLNKSFQDKLKLFASQMKAAYLFKKNSPMKLFLSQQNPYHIDRLLHYYHYMEKHNYESLSQLLNEMHTLSVHQNELDAMTLQVKELKEAKLALINSQKAQKQAHQKTLQSLKKDLSQTMAALAISQQNDTELLSQLAKIKEIMTETSYKNNAAIPFFKPTPFTKAQGKLLWPIRKEPRPSLMSPFMIKAQEGESVHATYDGRVVFADRLKGFGLLMIVDHGEGYMSLYGQNQTLYKNVGDMIKRGDIVARVGAPGVGPSSELSDSGLYFEIRKNGKPENLVNWFN